jgi:prepilin-type N-terminal cleavage/methylation domain-containing protein
MLRNYRAQGFTLIELLVVIAIIAILAGMIFPVLQGVIKKGNGIDCLNNVRSVGLACIIYADHNRQGLMPRTATGQDSETPMHCLALLVDKGYLGGGKALLCGLDSEVSGDSYEDADDGPIARSQCSYSIEWRLRRNAKSGLALISDEPEAEGVNSVNHGTQDGEGESQNVFFLGGNTERLTSPRTDTDENIFAPSDDPGKTLGANDGAIGPTDVTQAWAPGE